jgi:crotonobetainyl-CoA:carnitine CoA-transferase CaiB-like acyl-CoA transferase
MTALEGIRVVDVGLLVQGPQAAMFLGELGANVIKVELPHIGDHARWITVAAGDRRAPFFVGCNRGKRSITLDLRTNDGRAVFLDLMAETDVVISNFVSGTMESWGVGYEDLRAVNPRLIYAAGSTFGPVGEGAFEKGADLAAQASGGLVHAMFDGPLGPSAAGVTIADHIASQNLASAVLAALFVRERTGAGQRVDSSLLGGQIYAQAAEYASTALTGTDLGTPSQGGHPGIPGIYGIVPTADGAIAIVGIGIEERPNFFALIGAPELSEDARFSEFFVSGAVQAELFEKLGKQFIIRTTDEWTTILDGADMRWARVRTRSEVADDPAVYANGYLQRVNHPEWGELALASAPVHLSETPTVELGPNPELGQHTEEILIELGRSWDDIAALRETGAI